MVDDGTIQQEAALDMLDEVSQTITHQIPVGTAVATGRRAPSLVVVSGYALGSIHTLSNEPITIGRDPDNEIVIEDVGASRQHVRIERLGERAVGRDLGSKNGTFVNDEQIEEKLLQDGDLIHVGRTTYKFLAGNNVEVSYYEGLHEVAMQDPLTELPNRRYFDEVLNREFARAKRHGRKLVLLLADLDRFKNINDTYGHVAGDVVLREFAALIRGRVRNSEFFACYGGEEFAFIMPEADIEGAWIFAETVRRKVSETAFPCGDGDLTVTVSIGGAALADGMKGAEDLLNAADERLYEAKRAGRNRVVL